VPDYDRLRYEELASISEFLHGLSEEQWDHNTLCNAWRVRDVVGHIVLGYTTPMFSMIAMAARYGSLLLALTGRPIVLDELTGGGVPALRDRIGG
jgi:hypothetical protein